MRWFATTVTTDDGVGTLDGNGRGVIFVVNVWRPTGPVWMFCITRLSENANQRPAEAAISARNWCSSGRSNFRRRTAVCQVAWSQYWTASSTVLNPRRAPLGKPRISKSASTLDMRYQHRSSRIGIQGDLHRAGAHSGVTSGDSIDLLAFVRRFNGPATRRPEVGGTEQGLDDPGIYERIRCRTLCITNSDTLPKTCPEGGLSIPNDMANERTGQREGNKRETDLRGQASRGIPSAEQQ